MKNIYICYNYLQSLLKTPFPEYGGADPSRKWPEEDLKEFIKGLKHYGKNFFKIRQEYLPHRETPELVEFYYLWKKTPGAANNRPRGRPGGRHRPGVMRRVKTGGKPPGKNNRNEDDPDDLSSCSEEPEDEEKHMAENEDDNLSPYYCRHCYTTDSRDWHHAGKEKLLVCLDCRLYFKKYGELPCLEPNEKIEEELTESSEEEEPEIKPDKNLDLKAIEQDSSEDPYMNGNSTTHEPVEIKGELPKSVGLVSPVPTMPAHVPNPSQGMIPHPLTSASVNSLQPTASTNLQPPPPAHSNNDVQILSTTSRQPPPQPEPRREPSPPPKPDGTECHRSQSAIFTRQWNRGEGNSCSRTDLYFKPVPDSKLARKREERLRKANEKEDQIRAQQQAQEQAAKVARMDMNPFDPFARRTPSAHPPPGMGLPPLGSPYGQMMEHERIERERAAAVNAALVAAASASPRPPYPPNAPGTPGPPPGSSAFGLSLETRRLEEMMRASAERQYAERMALATDPLVRLQMAGVNPEIPGAALHPAYANLLAGNPLAGPRPPPGFDPRFRSPADIMSVMRHGPPGYPPRGPGPGLAPDFLQRQLMMDREASLRAASAQQLMAQQEEYLRLEQEARARQQAAVSRP